MLKIFAFYLCWTILLVSGNGNGTAEPKSNVSPVDASVTPKHVDKSSIMDPIEPTAAPTKPTKPPMTTTITPPTTTTTTTTTTTVKPNPPAPTPDSNITTSTAAPNTTTAAPTTTVPPPPTTPVPPAKTGTWIVNGTNQTCIVVRMAVEFNISYITKDNKTESKMLTLPSDEKSTSTTGDCGAKEQTMTIKWHGGNDSLSLHFVMNETSKNYYMHHVEVILTSAEFPDGKSNATMELVHEAKQFTTGLTNSYRCMRLQTLNLTSVGTNDTVSLLKISDLQFQAFKTDKATTFGLAQDCSSDVPDVVPIAVGCALTALVIIVLGAYLVGRRRSQARGYLSM